MNIFPAFQKGVFDLIYGGMTSREPNFQKYPVQRFQAIVVLLLLEIIEYPFVLPSLQSMSSFIQNTNCQSSAFRLEIYLNISG